VALLNVKLAVQIVTVGL